jgi:hypothetical protein
MIFAVKIHFNIVLNIFDVILTLLKNFKNNISLIKDIVISKKSF